MPTFEVTSPDGRKFRVTAPDGATQADAINYIKAQQQGREQRMAALPQSMANIEADQKSYAPERGLVVDAGRQIGLTGRAVATGLAALPLTALEAGAGVGNLINRAMGREGNYSPTAQFTSALDQVLPTPETNTEKGVQVVGSMVAGARIPGQPPVPAARPVTRADAAIAEGARRQVPVFYDDVGGPTAKKLGTAAESLGSLGTGSGRAVQGQAAKAAAGELVDDYAPAVGDDIPVLIQQGLKRRLSGFRKGAGALYKRADAALAPAGTVNVQPMRAAIQARIAQEKSLGSAADQGTIATLEKYLNAPDGDFAHWRTLRSSLGADISDYYKGNSAIGSKGVDGLQDAKNALETAMEAHARAAGGAGFDAWKKADTFYRTNIVPFKEAGFKDLVKTAEPEKAWRYLLANNTESRAVRMFNGLDRKGREAVKFGLLREAQDAATGPKGEFSPAKFARYIETNDKAVGTFFKGSERADVDGFVNLMRHIERAGQYAENPPTGNRLIPVLLGGAAMIEPTTAATIGASGLTVRGLFQTQTGRSLLMAASRAKPGSPEMSRLLETISRYAASASVAGQANDGGQ